MSTIFKNTNITRICLGVLSLYLCACSGSDSSSSSENATELKSHIQLYAKIQGTADFDSLVFDCYGVDTVRFIQTDSIQVMEENLYPGEWTFIAKLYANGGILFQEGDITREIEIGDTTDISIPMTPLFGFLDVKIALGLENPNDIASGSLFIVSAEDTLEFQMELTPPFGYFETDALSLNTDYDIFIRLNDSNGDSVFTYSKTLTLTIDTPTQDWILEQQKGSALLSIIEASDFNVSVSMLFPNDSIARRPDPGEVIITEIRVEKATKNDSLEFVELYNGTLDSIRLDSCVLDSKNSNIVLPSKTLAPTSFLTLSTEENLSENHMVLDSNFEFTSTQGTVVLFCDGILIDSLAYSSNDTTGQNLISITTADSSTQLPLSSWESRKDSSAWCIDEPTPGADAQCGDN